MLPTDNPNAAKSEKAWQAANKTVVTVLGGLQAYAAQHESAGGEHIDVLSAAGCEISLGPPDPEMLAEAVAQHKAADVTVLVVGDSTATTAGFGHESCGEGADRSGLDLFGQQMQLLDALVSSNSSSRLVVVLIHGRPATFGPGNQALAGVDALLAAWRPGEAAGDAIARLLFGDVSPSARLTQAWVQAAQDVHSPGNPWFQPFQADGGTKPNKNNDDLGPSSVLFPFG